MKKKLWQWYSEHDKRWRYRVEGQKVDNPYTPADRETVVLLSIDQMLGILDAAEVKYSRADLEGKFSDFILSTEENYGIEAMENEGYQIYSERWEWDND
jgi:hypothetical protein